MLRENKFPVGPTPEAFIFFSRVWNVDSVQATALILKAYNFCFYYITKHSYH